MMRMNWNYIHSVESHSNKVIYNSTLNHSEKICSSCTVYIVLFVILFIINISINSLFIYFHWYLKRKYIETTIYWMQFRWTHKWEILSKLILRIVHITFLMMWLTLKTLIQASITIDKKPYKNIGVYNIGYITTKKFDDYENNNSENLLYLIIGKADI